MEKNKLKKDSIQDFRPIRFGKMDRTANKENLTEVQKIIKT